MERMQTSKRAVCQYSFRHASNYSTTHLQALLIIWHIYIAASAWTGQNGMDVLLHCSCFMTKTLSPWSIRDCNTPFNQLMRQ